MAGVITCDDVLTEKDVQNILEELLPAQNRSYELGLKLNLPPHQVESIHSTYTDPRKRLLQIVIQFLSQLEPRPTWKVIVYALKSPVVNLPRLGEAIEAVYVNIPLSCVHTVLSDDSCAQSAAITSVSSLPLQSTTSHYAPAFCEVLTPNDAIKVLEELLPAKNKSYELGLKLSLPPHEVESIHSTYNDPNKRLLRVVILFLNQLEPRPTWRIIVDALKSPVINLPELGRAMEEAYFPNTTSAPILEVSSQSQPPTLVSSQAVPSTSQSVTEPSLTEVEHQPSDSSSPMTHQYVKTMIASFEKWFNELKKATRECLEKHKISIKQIADALTSLPADDIEEHKLFLERHMSTLYQAPDHFQLFGTLNLNWNYLSYQLLDHLIREFDLDTKNDMESYKQDLQMFREKTLLAVFCETQKKKWIKPSPEFEEVVARVEWPQNVTLEVVEQFRQAFASHYNLRECAIMLAAIQTGCFIITWFIPASILNKLKKNIPEHILKQYSVVDLEIAGVCIFSNKKPIKRAAPSYALSEKGTLAEVEDTSHRKSQKLSTEYLPKQTESTHERQEPRKSLQTPAEDYLFVKSPSDDFFCPHLSEECVTRIQGEGGPCPLCKTPDWSTVLNKHFGRQVNSLRVFCRHKEKGCWWEGTLSDFDHHVQSCPLRLLENITQGRTELHDAVERGDIVAVKELLKTPNKINCRTEREGDTALHIASKRGFIDIVELLVNTQAAVNVVDKNSRTPLFWASSRGYSTVVELLLQKSADVNIPNKDGLSPLYSACQDGFTDIVNVLLQAGADVNQAYTKEPCGVPLSIAAGEGHIKTVLRLVEAGATVNYQDKFGQTPILHASSAGHAAVVQLLLQYGADINEIGRSPLYSASQEGHTDVVDILINAGANVNATLTEMDGFPLAIAAQEGHIETVQQLLQGGANVNHQTKEGSTALLYAAKKGHLAVAKELLRAGARDIPNKWTVTALKWAQINNHSDVVQCLLEYKTK